MLCLSTEDQDARDPAFQPTQAELNEAILTLSSNNLPLLVHWISFDPGKSVFIPIFRVMPLWFNQLSIFDSVVQKEERGNLLAGAAVNTFELLGPRGTPAIPQLGDTLRKGSLVPGSRALQALGYIGEPALPTILSAASLTNCPTRHLAIRSFWAHTNNPAVHNFLTYALNNPDSHVRDDAAAALKAIEPY
jgi:hypothetical protein